MVVHESFVTRKPLEFTLIVLVIVLVVLLPFYFITKNNNAAQVEQGQLIPETYSEVNYLFGPDSDLSESDKKHLFQLNYMGNFVQWSGSMLSCDGMGSMFRVSIDETGDGFGDVIFTTINDCTGVPAGATMTFKTRLVDWKITTFIGKDGEIIRWE
ncbi:hypothetical protein JW898_06180 [Candidatus Woesearchaeota archaeon]|nr:hypothetical protein [Candidatus Woesearchaeota archaeon]